MATETQEGTTGFVTSDIPPNQTLYINNLNEKVKKAALKKALLAVFSPFGKVIDIVACKTARLRGQAWVVYENAAAATNALRQMQGTPLYDKPMRIQFAKAKSDAAAKQEGTLTGVKRKRDDDDTEGAPTAKRTYTGEATMIPAPPAARAAVAHSILLVTGLTADATEEVVRQLFGKFAGLKEVRMIADRGMAFVEYDTEAAATPALQGLNNFRVSASCVLAVNYAKK